MVPLEIEISPSAALIEAGPSLQLTIQSHDAARSPAFRHHTIVNRGLHAIVTGRQHDSYLAVPLKKSEAAEISLACK